MAAPSYDPYLNFNPTFKYGGRSWGVNDMDAFKKLLKKRGVNYDKWARNHATAARAFDPVEQEMYGTYKPQFDAINVERKRAEDAARRRMNDLAGFTQAIMGMLGEISPHIRNAYGEGAETMRSGGTGFGDVLNKNNAASAEQGNSILDAIGAPEGQKLQGGDAGGVLAGLAGWLPADMMSAQGNAYGDMFAQLPKEASFQSQLQMKKEMEQAREQDEDFSNEILGIINGMPAARADLVERRTAMKMAKQKARLDQLNEDREFALKQAAYYKAVGDSKRSDQYLKLAQQKEKRYAMEAQGRDPNGDLMPGYAETPDGTVYNMKDFHVDKHGNLVKNKSGSSGGLTPTQRASQIEAIDGKEDDIKAMIAKAVQNKEWFIGVGPPVPGSRARLAKKILARYAHLATTPTAKKRLRALVAQLLNEAAKAGSASKGGVPGGSSTIVIPDAP